MRIFVVLLALVSACAADDYTISGIVVDHSTNRPLKHVLVEIMNVGKGGESASVVTEADGRFVFLHVPNGKYNLNAQKRGQNPQGFHSGSDGFATALVVDGRQKTDDIVFPLRSDSIISGTVAAEDGEPVRNAQVNLLQEGVFAGENITTQTDSTNTNSAGQFHFGHLEAGKYYIAVSGTPWYSQAGEETAYPVTFFGDSTQGSAARSITLTEGVSVNVQIEVHAVPTIHVKVVNNRPGFQLVVPGPGGSQIPVSMRLMNLADAGRPVAIKGRARGRFTPVVPGENTDWELTNIAAGHYEAMVAGENNEQVRQAVDLMDGSTLSLDMPASTASISGRIVFDSPRPAGELNLLLSGGSGGARAVVAADGSFKFERNPAGMFDLELNSPSLVVTSFQAKGARVVNERLEVAGGASAELTIHAQDRETLAKVGGFAIKGGTGVAGAMVLLLPQDFARASLIRRDQSDADGSFSLTGVQPGRYTLIAIDDGRELAYKNEQLIKPYLSSGLSVTIPLKSNEPLKVPVQTRTP
jgi:hypothetical protein